MIFGFSTAIERLGAFLNKAKEMGYVFAVHTRNEGHEPKDRIHDVSGLMTWKQESGKVIFYKAGVEQFEISSDSKDFISLVCMDSAEDYVPCFRMGRNSHLHINVEPLIKIWFSL